MKTKEEIEEQIKQYQRSIKESKERIQSRYSTTDTLLDEARNIQLDSCIINTLKWVMEK